MVKIKCSIFKMGKLAPRTMEVATLQTVFGVCEWDVAKNSDLGQGFEVLSSLSVTGSVTFLSPLLATVFLLGDLSSTPSNPNILGLFLTGLFGVS